MWFGIKISLKREKINSVKIGTTTAHSLLGVEADLNLAAAVFPNDTPLFPIQANRARLSADLMHDR